MSSFFCSSSSRTSLEEDVFVSDPQDQAQGSCGFRNGEDALVQDCSSLALPDLVSCLREQADSVCPEQTGGGERGRPPLEDSCLRYYHVFREGELTQLIQEHVEELHVLHTCLDHANWCVVAEKTQAWRV